MSDDKKVNGIEEVKIYAQGLGERTRSAIILEQRHNGGMYQRLVYENVSDLLCLQHLLNRTINKITDDSERKL